MNEHDEQKEAIVATTQEAVQISAIVPTLTVDDLQKSITFCEALGFAIDERWEEKGTLRRAHSPDRRRRSPAQWRGKISRRRAWGLRFA
jgi:hypothetical protein